MSTLFITCGLPSSGKTRLAKFLEVEHKAVRLTADEWLHSLHPEMSGLELDTMRGPVEEVQWDLALRLLDLECNVVLDWGLWAREERDRYRSEAQARGATVVLCVLDPPVEILRKRLAMRNAQLPPGTFEIPQTLFDAACSLFQRPDADEPALFDDVVEGGNVIFQPEER